MTGVQTCALPIYDPEPFLAFGEFLLKSGELQDAASRFLAAQEGRSIFPWASYVLGATLLKIWELEQAEIALKPLGDGDSRAEFLRGQIAKLSGNEVAVRDLHIARSLSAGAHFPDPFLTLGGLASEEKKHRLSEFFYAMALRYDQQNSEALLGLAQSRFSADSPSRAIAFLEERLKAQPKSAPIMTDLAMIYLKWGDDVSGKTHFQNAIRSDQKYAEAFRLLGNLTKEEGDKQRDFLAKRNDYRYALACYEMY